MSKPRGRLKVHIDGDFRWQSPGGKHLIVALVIIVVVILQMIGDGSTIQLFL